MAPGSFREPISKVDTAWLRMEQPTNLMMITGVIGLDEGATYEQLVETVRKRFLAFRRFRQKAVDNATRAYWVDDEDFDIHDHVRRAALPGRADKQELEDFVSDLASTPLNHSRPLWQFHFIENYLGGPAVVMRIHHCYADGIALVQVMLTLTDTTRESRPSALDPEVWKQRRTRESGIFQRLTQPARGSIEFAGHIGLKLLEEGVRMIREPARAGNMAGEGLEILWEFGSTLALPDDPVTLLKGSLGVRKEVAWAEPVPLSEVKALGRALQCTVNDILIAAVSGALRRYLLDHGHTLESGAEIRATVPVNLRPLEHARELGNHFGMVFLALPISESNPLARVYAVNERMSELKNGKQATMAFGVLAALGMGPSVLQKPSLELLSRKASTVLTNVPGPRQPLYLAGGKIRNMMFWVPQTGSIGMGVSILSYDDKVFFGLITDRKIVPDPHPIVSQFGPELERLLQLVMMLPLGRRPLPDLADKLLQVSLASSGD